MTVQPLPVAREEAFLFPNTLPELYPQPIFAGATQPFWLQGTQVRVTMDDGDGPPTGVSDAIVYRFPTGQDRNATPMSTGLRTDDRGYLQGRDRIEPGDRLVALHPITATEKFTVYATSAQPGLTGLDSFEVAQTDVQTLIVSPNLLLILFNLTIALEWDARNDRQYLDDLIEDLRRTSALLYDLTAVHVQVRNLPPVLSLRARLYPAHDLTETTPTAAISLIWDEDKLSYIGLIPTKRLWLEVFLLLYRQDQETASPTVDDLQQGVLIDYRLGNSPAVRLVNIWLMLTDGSTLNLADGNSHQVDAGETLNLADGSTLNLADGNTPIRSSDGQVTIFIDNLSLGWDEFYTLQAIALIPDAPPWTTVIGNAYAITTSATLTEPLNGSISFQYLGRDIALRHEHLLHIYYYHDRQWQRLNTERDPVHNLAVADAPGPGIYALMYSIEVPIAASGWNLIAYPIQQSASITEGLSSIHGNYSTVYVYDSTDTEEWQRWKVYDVDAPAYVNTLDRLDFGRGYWISVTEAITLYLKDLDAETTQAASANLGRPPALYYGTVANDQRLLPTTDLSISAWIDGRLCGRGQSLWWQDKLVYKLVVSAADENHEGCGALGKAVQLQVNGQPLEEMLSWDNRRPQEIALRVPAPTASEEEEEDQIQQFLPIVVR